MLKKIKEKKRIEKDSWSEAASENNTVWGEVSFVWCWVVRRVRKNKGLRAGLEAQLGIWLELLDWQGQEAGQRAFGSSSLGITATMRKWMNTGRLAPFLACSAATLGEKGPWRASKTQYFLNFAPSCHKLSTYSVLAPRDTGMSKRKTVPVPEDIIKTTATKMTNREIKTQPDRWDCELCTKCCQKREAGKNISVGSWRMNRSFPSNDNNHIYSSYLLRTCFAQESLLDTFQLLFYIKMMPSIYWMSSLCQTLF